MERFDAVVVGAGIMGSCAAFELARRGLSVLLLEQFDLLHRRGSSHGESRTTRATYPEPYYARMAVLARALWLDAEALAGVQVLTSTPHLDLGPADCPSLLLAASHCPVPHRVLAADALAAEFSGAFRLPEGWTAVVSDLGGVINPTKAVAMFHQLARAHGAVIRDRVRVAAVQRRREDGALVVQGEKGAVFLAGKVVVAAGAWSATLLGDAAGPRLPIQPLHATLCYWRVREGREAEVAAAGGFPTFASYGEPYIYGTPSLEYPGLVKVALHGGVACDPDRRCWAAGAEDAASAVRPFVEEVLGGVVDAAAGPVMTQGCMYSMTPDGDFVVDFAGGELGRDVVVAAGFSGHGFKMAPLVGKVVAEMLAGEEVTDVELRHLRAARFLEDPSGNSKDFQHPVTMK